MKRVIPYVASNYRRDKIWLRRTKPDKRRYQVILAIDDSKSMSDSQNNIFALQSASLIIKALSKLEIGDIGIISFGGSGYLSVVHPLGKPFSEADGSILVNRMKFDKDNKIEDKPMMELINAVLHILEKAEESFNPGI